MKKETLAEVLQKELGLRGWSLMRLAEEAGVSYETARRAKNGIGSITIDTATKILVAVDLDLTARPKGEKVYES